MDVIKKIFSNEIQISDWSQLGNKSKMKKKIINWLKKFFFKVSG